jgi:lauroyl/myristoyl acyltransferase
MIRIAGWIPWWKARQVIANRAGWLGYLVLPVWRERIAANLAMAYDKQPSPQETDRIVREYFREYWREALSLLPTAGDRALLRQARIEGWEHLEQALQKGRGAILWEASLFGSRNVSKLILRQKDIPVHQVHAANHLGWTGIDLGSGTWLRRRVVVPTLRRWMASLVESIIWLPETESLAFARVLLQLLKHNGVVCSSADGSQGERLASAEFLGRRRPFATGMASLARVSGAPLLPLFCIQDPEGMPTLIIGPPITVDASANRQGALQSCVEQWVTLLESHVRSHPGKYRGWYTLYDHEQVQ